MPDDRLFHKRLGHSVKVNALTDFEDIVWRTYIQAADDFGVMRFLALPLQDLYDRLAQHPARTVQRALERVAAVGLVRTFTHQGHAYCYQHDWQDYQKVEYPRTAILPKPPADALDGCTALTQYLFRFHPGGLRIPSLKSRSNSGNDSGKVPGMIPGKFTESSGNDSGKVPGMIPGKFPESSGNDSGTSRARSRAPGRTLTAKTNGEWLTEGDARGSNSEASPEPQAELSDELHGRATRFCARYAELFAVHRRGAKYLNKASVDLDEALALVSTWDDARLELLAEAFLTTDEPFCRNGSGSIAQFRSRASWCDTKLREAGL